MVDEMVEKLVELKVAQSAAKLDSGWVVQTVAGMAAL
jgi:hypothetical protein